MKMALRKTRALAADSFRLSFDRLRATFGGRLSAAFRSLSATGRLFESVHRAELDGLAFAFRARLLAIAVVSLWILLLVHWPRSAYYFFLAVIFFFLGYVPYRLRHHRFAARIKFIFVILDVTLITVAILMPAPGDLSMVWPVQTRLRGETFLYCFFCSGSRAYVFAAAGAVDRCVDRNNLVGRRHLRQ